MKKGFIQEGQDGQNVSVRNAVPLGREKRDEDSRNAAQEEYVEERTSTEYVGRGSTKRKKKVRTVLLHVLLGVLALVWLFPILWIVMTSLRGEAGSYFTTFFPKEITFANFTRLFTETDVLNFPRWFSNTLIVSIFTCVISTFFVLAVSYSMSRMRFKMRKPFMNVALVLGMFPAFMSMIAVYYILKGINLTEGVMKLVSLVLVAVSGLAAAAYAGGSVGPDRLRLMVFSQVLIMLVAALMGCGQLLEGLGDLFIRGRFTLNTLLAVTFAACSCDAIYCLQEERVPLCAAFALEVAMSLWAELQRYNTELGQMDTLRKAIRLDGLYRVEDFYEGQAGIIRDVGDVDSFMDHYRKISVPELRQSRYAMVSFFVSLGVSITAGLLHGVPMALLMLSTTLLVSVPASFFVSLTRPAAVLERRLHRLGTVICGWQGIRGMGGRVAVPLHDVDMFPRGTTKMNGVKFYGDRDPEECIAYASALICAGGGGLAPLFEDLLQSRGGPEYDVKAFRRYPGGGIGGEVCGEPVLVGTLQFLKDMGVEVPAGTMVNQAVHLSIDGTLCGLFAINYNRSKYSASGLAPWLPTGRSPRWSRRATSCSTTAFSGPSSASTPSGWPSPTCVPGSP